MELPKFFKSETPITSDENKAEAIKDISEMEELIEMIEKTKDELKKAIDENDTVSQNTISLKLKETLSQAKSLQRKMEGKSSSKISAEYSYKDGKGKEVKETIQLDFETELSSLTNFYKKHSIGLPADFAEQMQDIWEKNADAIKEAMEEKGFNKVLFIPENLPPLKDLEEKMTEGYEKEKGNKTNWWIEAESITDIRKEPRIVLVHDATDLTLQPELKKTLDKKYGGENEDGKDNKAEDFIKQGEALTLSEYLILQRDVFEKTGIHLDSKKTPDVSYVYWTWLPGSKSGSRVVHSNFRPGDGQVAVAANDPDYSDGSLGCRLSRSFK